MSATAKQIIEIAASQIGVCEDPPFSNEQPYGAAYGWNGVPWCVIFLWWCFREAGASDLFCGGQKVAAVEQVMNYAKSHGQWVTYNYKPGDVVCYDFEMDGSEDHVGIVESVNVASVVAIEGNTSNYGSQSNGGEVLRKTRPLYQIMGALRPAYATDDDPDVPDVPGGDDDDNNEEEEFDVATLKMISKGSSGQQVRSMQILLIGYGFSCGSYGPDGVCGVLTDAAIRNFQHAHGLEEDGICGPITWAALLGAN